MLRVIRYLLPYPLWGDEAYLAVNLFERSLDELLAPLRYDQVAPCGFLWLQWLAIHMLGPGERALRLLPCLAGCLAVVLFAWGARFQLRGWSWVWSVACLALAYYPLRHSTECKQYASDLCVACALFSATLAYRHAPTRLHTRGLFLALAVGPWLSLPACFLSAACLLALLIPVAQTPNRKRITAWLIACTIAGFSMLSVYLLQIRPQRLAAESTSLPGYWGQSFPPAWQHPLALATWLWQTFTGLMFAYPVGAKGGGSACTTLCVVVGISYAWQRKKNFLLVLCLTPFCIGLLAATKELYPFGANIRLVYYLAPGICLLAGQGLSVLLHASAKWSAAVSLLSPATVTSGPLRRPNRTAQLRRLHAYVLTACCLLGAAQLVTMLVRPYKMPYDWQEREFAHWLWTELAKDGEVVCLHSDLQVDLEPGIWNTSHSAVYLANQRIYSPRHRQQLPANWSSVSPARPLRVVVWTLRIDHPPAALQAWLAAMDGQYQLIQRRRFPVNQGTPFPTMLDVFEFFPKQTPAAKPDLAALPAELRSAPPLGPHPRLK